ncbi:hypothetical protein GGR55DRAFT_383290 [Xylaria sp. FL0064]|nr:hypothetical protein GGR55DRAFT_383290 [Xylaria sp. FL0064]
MSTTVHLKATYTSPDVPNPQTISSAPLALPSSLSDSQSNSESTTTQAVEDKTAFLRALRAATTDLQDRINADLTARMEQDAANAGSGSTKMAQGGAGAAAVNEAAEEENYGEEVAEEDDEV